MAIAMRNLPEWSVAFWSTVVSGAIVVPLNAWLTGAELEYALADSGCRFLLCDAERLARFAPHRAQLSSLQVIIATRCEHDLPLDAHRWEDIVGRTAEYAALPDRALPPVTIDPRPTRKMPCC